MARKRLSHECLLFGSEQVESGCAKIELWVVTYGGEEVASEHLLTAVKRVSRECLLSAVQLECMLMSEKRLTH